MARRRKKTFGNPSGKYAALPLSVIDTPAWRALSSTAQSLVPWLIMEFKGADLNNNGKISLSVRQAAERMGVARDTAAKAFRDLQAKGFIIVKKGASLGVEGHGKCPEYEITFITTPHKEASKLYLEWSEDNDFPIFAHPVKNPTGKSKPCHNYQLNASLIL
jgi:hypothetical protein